MGHKYYNVPLQDGKSALILGADNGHVAVCTALLDQGAVLDRTDLVCA